MRHSLSSVSQRWLAAVLALTMITGVACASASAPMSSDSGSSSSTATKAVPPVAPSAPLADSTGMSAPAFRPPAGVPGSALAAGPAPSSGNALERKGQSPAAPPPAPASCTSDTPRPTQGQNQDFSRMIIDNTAITLTVKDVPASGAEVSTLATRSGGYISGSSVRQEGERTFASINILVPAQGYAEVMSALRGMGLKVESEKDSAQDLTEEFTDLESQVRNLRVTEEQLRTLMAKATTIDEILRVQSQISTVQGQIDRLKGRQIFLQHNAELATINVSLQPELPAKTTTLSNGWDPLKIAEESWQESLKVIQAFATVGIRVLVFSWWLIPVVALAVATYASCRIRTGPTALATPAAPESGAAPS